MPTLKTGGATIVAIAALCLTTNSVQAAVVNLVIDPTLSSLQLSGNIDASSVGGKAFANLVLIPQAPGSDIASYSGSINIDLQPGTIQLLNGSSIVAATTGNYAPEDNGTGTPNGLSTSPGNYGMQIPSIAAFINYNGLVLDFGAPINTDPTDGPVLPGGLPSTPMPLVGNNFDLTGQAMSYIAGRNAIVSGLGNGAGGVSGFPTIFSTLSLDQGTWDGTTLTIPVHSSVTYLVEDAPLIPSTIVFVGQIVAHVIPEPSTMVMAGLGVFGLIAAGYRARKRKA